MSERLKVARGSALALVSLFLLAAHYIEPEGIAAAPGLKKVMPFPAQTNYPVVVTKIALGNAVVQKGIFAKGPIRTPAELPTTPFQAGDDWIENLSVYLLNRSDKTIVHGFINFTFPDVAPFFQLELGNIPAAFAFGKSGQAAVRRPLPDFRFGPKQTVVIRLGDYIDRIKAAVEPSTHTLSSLSEMHVGLSIFDFEDGMRWGGASYEVMDPTTHTWSPMAAGYFPGNMDLYWPGRPGWIDPE